MKNKKRIQKEVILLICLVSIICCISSVSAVYTWNSTLNNGLVCYYNLSEGSGGTTKDASGHQQNATLQNIAGWTSGPNGNNAIIFDGRAYASMFTNLTSSYTQNSQFSFSFWLKVKSGALGDAGGPGGSEIVGLNNYATSWVGDWNGFNVMMNFPGSQLYGFRIINGAYNSKLSDVDDAIPDSAWTHYVISYNGTVAGAGWKVYRNGVDVSPPTKDWLYFQDATPYFSVSTLVVGDMLGPAIPSSQFIKANMSEIGFWNRSLSLSEAQQLYNSGSGITWISTDDSNPPNATLLTPENNSIKNTDQNFSANITDDFSLQNATLFIYNQTNSEVNNTVFTSINGLTQSVVGVIVILTDGIYKWNYLVFDSSGKNYTTGNNTVTIDKTAPIVNNMVATSTGGIIGSNFIFNQILNNITFNVTEANNNNLTINLTLTDPDNVLIINNQNLKNISQNIFYYNLTQISLNKAGNWIVNISSNDGLNLNYTNFIISVSTLNVSIAENWYGYTNNSILSSQEINDTIGYSYNLYEIRANTSSIDTDFNSVLQSINFSNGQNVKVGINYLINTNITNSSQLEALKLNITSLFPQLLNSPYYSTILYISLEIDDKNKYIDSQIYNNLNIISQNLTQTINNKFVIYAKNYTSGNLNPQYIKPTTMLYLQPINEADWINKEASFGRSYSVSNRIYTSVPTATLRGEIKTFHNNIISNLRFPFNTTLIYSDGMVAATSNGDIVVFNNLSSAINKQFNFSNVTIKSKDFYDFTHHYVIVQNSSNLTFNVIVDQYNATLIFAENIDHLEMISNTLGDVYQSSGINSRESNWTDGTLDDNFALYGANDIRTELYDPFYVQQNFMVYYGWLNASYINFQYTNYSAMIIADKNAPEVAKLSGLSAGNVYGYISVADYNNTAGWTTAKELEVDSWIATNSSMNLFIDGLDIGLVGGLNFSSRFKDLIDYVRITKGKKAILNTYTAYEQFATWGDGIMKESCVERWNGANAGSPDNYSREDWGLEITRAKWFQSHGIPVYCQAFNNRTTNPVQIENYTDLMNVFFASKVLGYQYFYLTQPDFNYAYQIFTTDVGSSMSNDFFTDDNETFYRRYTKGIVYYNKTSHQGWFENGRIINSVQVCFNIYDAHANSVSLDFYINKNYDSPPSSGDYHISDGNMTLFGWKRVCQTVNASLSGQYVIDAFVNPRSTIVGQGLNIGAEVVTGNGVHSWFDTTAGAYTWFNYPQGKNWEVYLVLNETSKSLLDPSVTSIIQTNTNTTLYKYNLTLNSFYHQDKKIYSYIQNVQITNSSHNFKSIAYTSNGIDYVLNVTNSSDCITSEPVFNLSLINGEIFGACYYGNSSEVNWRVQVPSLSSREFELELNHTAPPNGTLFPVNGTYSFSQINYTVTSFDDGGLDNATLYIYNSTNSLINQTTINATNNPNTFVFGTVVNLVDGIYNWFYKIFDLGANSFTTNNNTVIIDTTYPLIDFGSGTEANNANFTQTFVYINVTLTEINFQNISFFIDGSAVSYNTPVLIYNKTGLTAGAHTYYVKTCDKVNLCNQTATRTIILNAASVPAEAGAGGGGGNWVSVTDNASLLITTLFSVDVNYDNNLLYESDNIITVLCKNINGTLMDIENITLKEAEEKKIAYSVVRKSVGTYEVKFKVLNDTVQNLNLELSVQQGNKIITKNIAYGGISSKYLSGITGRAIAGLEGAYTWSTENVLFIFIVLAIMGIMVLLSVVINNFTKH